jgi:hypothetical protein
VAESASLILGNAELRLPAMPGEDEEQTPLWGRKIIYFFILISAKMTFVKKISAAGEAPHELGYLSFL